MTTDDTDKHNVYSDTNISIIRYGENYILELREITDETNLEEIKNTLSANSTFIDKTTALHLKKSTITIEGYNQLRDLLPTNLNNIYLDNYSIKLTKTMRDSHKNAKIILCKSAYVKGDQLIIFNLHDITYIITYFEGETHSNIKTLHLNNCKFDNKTPNLLISPLKELVTINIHSNVTVPSNIIEIYPHFLIMFSFSAFVLNNTIHFTPVATKEDVQSTLQQHQNLFLDLKRLNIANMSPKLSKKDFFQKILRFLPHLKEIVITKNKRINYSGSVDEIINHLQWVQGSQRSSDSSDEETELQTSSDSSDEEELYNNNTPRSAVHFLYCKNKPDSKQL